MSDTSFCTDECDLAGKTFVDLGSGVGQVWIWQPARSKHATRCPSLHTCNSQVCMMIAALSSASRSTALFLISVA